VFRAVSENERRARPGRRVRADVGLRRGQRRDGGVYQAAGDASIGEGASARPALSPRSPWTSSERPSARDRRMQGSCIRGGAAVSTCASAAVQSGRAACAGEALALHAKRVISLCRSRLSERSGCSVSPLASHVKQDGDDEERQAACEPLRLVDRRSRGDDDVLGVAHERDVESAGPTRAGIGFPAVSRRNSAIGRGGRRSRVPRPRPRTRKFGRPRRAVLRLPPSGVAAGGAATRPMRFLGRA
jgi:hypothetical protein